MNLTKNPLLVFLLSWLSLFACQEEKGIRIAVPPGAPPVQHAVQQLAALQVDNLWKIQGQLDSTGLAPEAYRISVAGEQITVSGGDAVGLMYGLLDIKTQLSHGLSAIQEKQITPQLSFRAIKFNLPWDSYRASEALQLHTETCRDTLFWRAFLDMMAENRFNKLTLWNMHPFNYLVKTEQYPEASGFNEAEFANWQQFWHTLFRMAKDRGIETYLINWNIFVSPEFARAHGVAEYSIGTNHFIKQGDTSAIVKDYMRESVRAVIDEYPDLTGLGITLGEGMGSMTAAEREQWLLDGYMQGMREASRKIKFIHRVPLSAGKGSGGSTSVSVEQLTRRTLDTLSCVDGPINIELKFNWSHAFSSPHLVKVHGGKLTDTYWNPLPENYRLAWMLRNEDFFMLRWGQPDFIRQHLANNVHPYVNGYFVGSECYIPAKDYLTALDGASYRYAFERQWMYYKVIGHLLYDPQTPDAFFEQAFLQRFPQHGQQLFSAQTKISRVPLIIASYWNATWDFTLYSEGMISLLGNDRMRLLSLQQFCEKDPLEPAYLSIQEFLSDTTDVAGKISPLHLADSLDAFCTQALREVAAIVPAENVDLLYEQADIQTWAQLGQYFADKLRAAVAYQRYRNTHEKAQHTDAVRWLEQATEHWQQVVAITEPVYRPVPLMHYERNENAYFHWSVVAAEVREELAQLKAEEPTNK